MREREDGDAKWGISGYDEVGKVNPSIAACETSPQPILVRWRLEQPSPGAGLRGAANATTRTNVPTCFASVLVRNTSGGLLHPD